MHGTVVWTLPTGIHILSCNAVPFLTFEIKRRQTLSLRQMNPVCGHSDDRRSLAFQHVWLCAGVLASQLMSLSSSNCRFHSPGLILNLVPSLRVGSSTCSAPLAGKVSPWYLFTFPFYVADFNVVENEWMLRRTVNCRGPAE